MARFTPPGSTPVYSPFIVWLAGAVALTGWLVAILFLPACGPGLAATRDGWVASVGGRLVKVQDSEKEEVCADHACEPNYLYSVNFGPARRKTKPKPKPAPPVIPAEKLGYAHGVIGTAAAWNVTEGDGVVVAVIDSGVDLDQPDLKEALWVNTAEQNGKAGVDDDGNGYVDDVYGYDFANHRPNGRDDMGHGTHCAGIIAARRNDLGTVGVAPKARIMPLKFLNVTGSGDTMNAVEAIHYAVANGARIISASWGGAGRSEFLAQAVADAQAAGVIFVAAAGNAAWDIDSTPTYPAAFDGVVTVASTGPTDVMSSFSNFGPAHVMLSAPGEAIWSSLLKLHWGNLSGTSMATPHVSGALALALAVRPDLTVAQLKQALCDTAAPVNQDKVKCGRLDVGALVSSLAPPSSS